MPPPIKPINPFAAFNGAPPPPPGDGGGGSGPPSRGTLSDRDAAIAKAAEDAKKSSAPSQTYSLAQLQAAGFTSKNGSISGNAGGYFVFADKVGEDKYTLSYKNENGNVVPYSGNLGGSTGLPERSSTASTAQADKSAAFNASPGYDLKTFAQWGGSVIYPKDGSKPYGIFDAVNYDVGSDGKLHPVDAKVDPFATFKTATATAPYPNATGAQTEATAKPLPQGVTDADIKAIGAAQNVYTPKGSTEKLVSVQGITLTRSPDGKWYANGGTLPPLLAALYPANSGSTTASPMSGGSPSSSSQGGSSTGSTGGATTNPFASGSSGGDVQAHATDPNSADLDYIRGNNKYAQGVAAGTGFGVPSGKTYEIGSPEWKAATYDPYNLENPDEQARLSGAEVKPGVAIGRISGGGKGEGAYKSYLTLENQQNPGAGRADLTNDPFAEAAGGTVRYHAAGGDGAVVNEPAVLIPARELQPGQQVLLTVGERRPEMATDRGDALTVANHVPGTERYPPGSPDDQMGNDLMNMGPGHAAGGGTSILGQLARELSSMGHGGGSDPNAPWYINQTTGEWSQHPEAYSGDNYLAAKPGEQPPVQPSGIVPREGEGYGSGAAQFTRYFEDRPNHYSVLGTGQVGQTDPATGLASTADQHLNRVFDASRPDAWRDQGVEPVAPAGARTYDQAPGMPLAGYHLAGGGGATVDPFAATAPAVAAAPQIAPEAGWVANYMQDPKAFVGALRRLSSMGIKRESASLGSTPGATLNPFAMAA